MKTCASFAGGLGDMEQFTANGKRMVVPGFTEIQPFASFDDVIVPPMVEGESVRKKRMDEQAYVAIIPVHSYSYCTLIHTHTHSLSHTRLHACKVPPQPDAMLQLMSNVLVCYGGGSSQRRAFGFDKGEPSHRRTSRSQS